MKVLLSKRIPLLAALCLAWTGLSADRTIDVYKTIQPDKQTLQGTFQLKDGQLVGSAQSVLETSYDLPKEYNVIWEFSTSSTAVNLLLVSPKGKRFEWMMKGYEHKLCGLREVGGKEANKNPTTVEFFMASDRRYRCEVKVRKDRFVALIDGKEILNYRTDWSDVEIVHPWHAAKLRPRSLGIFGYKHFTKTFKLEVREVSASDFRTLVGRHGKKIEAIILHQGPKSMTIRRKDGLVFNFAYELLSEKDRLEFDPKFKTPKPPVLQPPAPKKPDNRTEAELVEELQSKLRKENNLPKLTAQWNAASKTLIVRGSGKGFSDLSPFEETNLQIEHLDLQRQHDLTNESLRSLSKLKLKSFHLAGSQIDDISALKGMPLERLGINVYGDMYTPKCKVSDLSPLQGMKLKQLHIDGCEVRSLGPLQGMPLEHLSMRDVSLVSDLSPLRNVTTLKYLHIAGTGVRSLDDLSMLKLDELRFGKTKVASLEPLKDMALVNLYGDNTMVSSIAPLKGDRLANLSLQSTLLNDISPVKNLLHVQTFLFANSKVKDFAPLTFCKKARAFSITDPRKAKNLEVLRDLPFSDISFKPSGPYIHTWLSVSDFWKWIADPSLILVPRGHHHLIIKPLPPPKPDNRTEAELVEELQSKLRKENNLPKLTAQWNAASKTLSVRGSGGSGKGHSDFSPFEETNLKIEHLDLQRQHDLTNESLRSLSKLKLKSLLLAGSKIDDISALKGMPLERLGINIYGDRYFPKCKVSDLSPLQGMKLKQLHMDGCEVRSLAPLQGMPLEHLSMRNASLASDLSPLRNVTTLKYLHIGGTGIRSLDDLSMLKLDQLRFEKTKVASLEPLKDMALMILNGDDTMVSSIAPLKGDRLTSLSLQSTLLNDLSPVKNLPNVRAFLFADSKVKDFAPLAACNNLSQVSITDPRMARNLDVLRDLPLDRISVKPRKPYRHTIISGVDFWKWIDDPSLKLVPHSWDHLIIKPPQQ